MTIIRSDKLSGVYFWPSDLSILGSQFISGVTEYNYGTLESPILGYTQPAVHKCTFVAVLKYLWMFSLAILFQFHSLYWDLALLGRYIRI